MNNLFYILFIADVIYSLKSRHKMRRPDKPADPKAAAKSSSPNSNLDPYAKDMTKLNKAFSASEPTQVAIEGWLKLSSNSFLVYIK